MVTSTEIILFVLIVVLHFVNYSLICRTSARWIKRTKRLHELIWDHRFDATEEKNANRDRITHLLGSINALKRDDR